MTLKFVPLSLAALLAGCSTVGDRGAPRDSFFAGSIQNVVRGEGDVVFVNSAGRWYRTELNEGCLSSVANKNLRFRFESRGSSKVDNFTQVQVQDGGGNLLIECRVRSVMLSGTPPMIDSDSTVPAS